MNPENSKTKKPPCRAAASLDGASASSSMAPPITKREHGRGRFYRHLSRALFLSAGVIGISLCVGVFGYHLIAGFGWVDSLLNAAMILSGMGPVGALDSDAAKIFASCYALFSGVVFIAASGILLSPMFHRVLHVFHIEQKDLE